MNQMQQLEQLMNQFRFRAPSAWAWAKPARCLSQLRGLERFLRWGQRGMGDPSELNLDELREILGDEAYEHLKYFKSVEQMLEEEGYIVRTNHGLQADTQRHEKDRRQGAAGNFSNAQQEPMGQSRDISAAAPRATAWRRPNNTSMAIRSTSISARRC